MKVNGAVPVLVLISVFALSSVTNADFTFSRIYSGFDTGGIQVAAAADGGFFISCIDHPDCCFGVMWLLRTDDDGNILWLRPFFESDTRYRDFESGAHILPASDGGCLITGYGEPRATGRDTEVCLVKVDSDGIIEWEQIIGDDDELVYTVSGIAGSENGCLLAVSHGQYGNSFFVMYDQEGNEIWRTEHLGEEYCTEAVTATNDGGFLAIVESGYGCNSWMLMIDGTGHMEWIPDLEDDLFGSIAYTRQTDDGGYVICGRTDDNYDAFLLRTDEQGSELWRYISGVEGIDRATWVEPTGSGMFALTGLEKVGDEYDGWLALLDDTGEMRWKRYYSFPGFDEIGCVCPTDDGGFILCGTTGSYENGGVWLLKTDENGLIAGSEDGYPAITECTEVFTEPLGWVVSCEVTEDAGSAEIHAETLAQELGIETGYLWIPDWPSLSEYEGWLIYAGPFSWLEDPELESGADYIRELYPEAYVIYVGSEPERTTMPLP